MIKAKIEQTPMIGEHLSLVFNSSDGRQSYYFEYNIDLREDNEMDIHVLIEELEKAVNILKKYTKEYSAHLIDEASKMEVEDV